MHTTAQLFARLWYAKDILYEVLLSKPWKGLRADSLLIYLRVFITSLFPVKKSLSGGHGSVVSPVKINCAQIGNKVPPSLI